MALNPLHQDLAGQIIRLEVERQALQALRAPPVFWVLTYHIALNQSRRGLRVPSKMAPAVNEVCRPQRTHSMSWLILPGGPSISDLSRTAIAGPRIHVSPRKRKPLTMDGAEVRVQAGVQESPAFNRVGWFARSGLVVLDQATYSSSTFLVNILLARWLLPVEYGAFAVAFSLFLFIAALHGAAVVEPMLVFAGGKYSQTLREYFRFLFRSHWILVLPMSALLLTSAFAISRLVSPSVGNALLGLSMAAPFMLLMQLLRRTLYFQHALTWSIGGGLVYLGLILLAIYTLSRANLLSTLSALLSVALCSLVVSTAFLLRVVTTVRTAPADVARPLTQTFLRDHWSYGSWSLSALAVWWLSGEVFSILVPAVLGLQAMAAMAAAGNLFRPLGPVMQSIGALLIPLVSKAYQNPDVDARNREIQGVMTHSIVPIVALVLLYGMALVVSGEAVMETLYRGQYDTHYLLLPFAVFYGASATTSILTAFLKGTGRVRSVLYVWAVPAALIMATSVPVLRLVGLSGAVWSLALSYILAAACAALQLKRALYPTFRTSRPHYP